MREGDVYLVALVLDVVEVVAVAVVVPRLQYPLRLELGQRLERRRLALTQVGEDQPEILARGIARDVHLGREARVLGGHLDALAGAVILPAVVEAAETVPFHPARAELRPPMRAARRDHVGRAVLAAVEREVLAH